MSILITGLPRCGSSWVGQCVSQVPGIRYRYESLNSDWVPALRGQLAHFRYQRPGSPGPERIRQAANRAFAGRQSPRQRLRGLYRGYAPSTFRRHGTLVLKDPTACLLAGWLSARQPCRVVVLTRHPCGFASSVSRLGWPMRLQRLLAQESLMRDHLAPHRETLEAACEDPFQALGALWAAVHTVLFSQAEAAKDTGIDGAPSDSASFTGPTWHFIAFEQLCLSPEAGFAALSAALGFTVAAPQPGGPHREDPGSTSKDGRRVALAWQQALTQDEIQRVMAPVDALGLREQAEAGLAQASA